MEMSPPRFRLSPEARNIFSLEWLRYLDEISGYNFYLVTAPKLYRVMLATALWQRHTRGNISNLPCVTRPVIIPDHPHQTCSTIPTFCLEIPKTQHASTRNSFAISNLQSSVIPPPFLWQL